MSRHTIVKETDTKYAEKFPDADKEALKDRQVS